MSYKILSPDNPTIQEYVFSGQNIVITGPDIEHINSCIGTLATEILDNNKIALGPALNENTQLEQGHLGSPAQTPKYNFGLMGLYVPLEFAKDVESVFESPITLNEAMNNANASLEEYITATKHVIEGYNSQK